MASRKYLQQLVTSLIGDNPDLPIDVDKIIRAKGLRLMPYNSPGVSGILMIDKNIATIGYSLNENSKRQRFTKAHELGHFLLHRGGNLFVDAEFKNMHRPTSGMPSDDWQEWEANEFAACLLMPELLVRKEMKGGEFDYTEDDWIQNLAKKFDVSTSAMSIRISKLGLL